MLEEDSHKLHKFKLPEEKTLRAVLRVITQILSIDEIKQNLTVRFGTTSFSRMHKRINGTRSGMAILLVQLINTAKKRNPRKPGPPFHNVTNARNVCSPHKLDQSKSPVQSNKPDQCLSQKQRPDLRE